MIGLNFEESTLIDFLIAINQKYSNSPALKIKCNDQYEIISYSNLTQKSLEIAYKLAELGIKQTDKVAILSENKPEWAVTFFGIISCGSIVVPIDIKLSDAEIEFILNDSESKFIFVSQTFLERINNLKLKLPNVKNIIYLDNVINQNILSEKDTSKKRIDLLSKNINSEDTVLLIYTSGTIGVSKGVELTHSNILFEVIQLNRSVKFTTKDNFLSILPLNHVLEITCGLMVPLYAGSCITYCDSLQPANIIKLMQETKTTIMICVPLILKMLYEGIMKKVESMPLIQRNMFHKLMNISDYLLKYNINIGKLLFNKVHKQFGGNLRCFVSGGAPLVSVVEEKFNTMGFIILQGYGLTETSPVITVNTFHERKYGSVGKPLPDIEVKILVNNEKSSEEGEIITRGHHVMKGYYKNDDKTKEILINGWFHTGDIGYFDDNGFLFISGRAKNLIVLGVGKKVFPEEVEEVISNSPYIKEICVLGKIADEGMRKGCEEVYAIIVPNLDNFETDKKNNKQFIRDKIASEITCWSQHLADYKRIMDFEIWEQELPKTATRKIKRKDLLDKISLVKKKPQVLNEEVYLENIEFTEDELTFQAKNIISKITKIPENQIKLQSNLYNDLGIDSLMKVEILVTLDEKYGINIPDRMVYEINTFADLVKFIREYKKGRSGDDSDIKQEINKIIKRNIQLKVFHNLAYFIFKKLFRIYFKQSVFEIKKLPPERSFIIAANHSSLLDFPLILTSLPFSKMKDILAPAAKDYFYSKPTRKTIVELLFNTFPFDRLGDFIKGIKVCEELIKNGKSIIIFPEGTRNVEDKIHPFKPGLGCMAYNLKVPIVPVYIKGALQSMPKGKIFPKPIKIEIYFGNTIYIDQLDFSNFENNYEKYLYISELTFKQIEIMKNRR